jgi:hypothetical protein
VKRETLDPSFLLQKDEDKEKEKGIIFATVCHSLQMKNYI